MHMNELPLEILQKIFSYLTIKEKFYCERICRHWQKNVFSTIQSLAFEKFDDVFHGRHQHPVWNADILPLKLNWNDEITKSIISKCGKYLRSFRGFVSQTIMLAIVENCKQLQCTNMFFYDLEGLEMLSDAYGKQLKCVTLYVNIRHGISPFISACSCLTSLAILKPPYSWYDRSEKSCNSFELFDLSMFPSQPPSSIALLKNLIIECGNVYVTQETLKRLVLLTTLDLAYISLTHDLNETSLWRSVMLSWASLTVLYLEVTSNCCIHLEPLPINLEFLSLKTVGYHTDGSGCKPVCLSSNLPKLKTLLMYLRDMPSDHVYTVTESVAMCCPVLEEFSIWASTGEGLNGCLDEQLMHLFSMNGLKQLALGSRFGISDGFASKLLIDIMQLTSFGTALSEANQFCKSLLPSGPLFWDSLRAKALSHPAETFNLVGEVKDTLYLHELLPSNIVVTLTGRVAVSLRNGFSHSEQWHELAQRSSQLERLNLELLDFNLSLSGLSESLEYLTIRCLNKEAGRPQDALTFSTYLPDLVSLTLFQQNMSNEQLGTTLEVIAEFCPKLRFFCLDRGNENTDYVDEQLGCMLKFQFLDCFCLTEKFSVSDLFSAKIVNEMKSIHRFGCSSNHELGLNCGPLFLNALVCKLEKGEYVTLSGGPSKEEIAEKIKHVPMPRNFHIFHSRKPKL